MYIKNLSLNNFRNIKNINIEFAQGLNILYGPNAIGKTNILESIYLLSTSKSFRTTSKFNNYINIDSEFCIINLTFLKDNIKNKLSFTIQKNATHLIKLNEKKIKVYQLLYNLIAIIISPYDISIIEDSPSIRRRFLDLNISRIDKTYLQELRKTNYIIKQKNILLKDIDINTQILDTYNYQLSFLYSKIISKRLNFIKNINKKLKEFNIKDINLQYKTNIKDISLDSIYRVLQNNKDREIQQKNSIIGPHRDDFSILQKGLNMKEFASQGEKKLAIILIKFAIKDIIEEIAKDKIIILIDDFSSSLDYKNQGILKEVFNKINQIIITDTKQLDINAQNKINIEEVLNAKN